MSIISVSAAPRTQGLAAYGSSVPGEFRFVTNNRSDFFPLHGHEKRCTLESSLLFPVSPHFVSVNSSLPLFQQIGARDLANSGVEVHYAGSPIAGSEYALPKGAD